MLLDRGSLLVIVHEEGLVRGWNQCVLETSRYFLAKNTLIFYWFLMILDRPSRRWVCPGNSQKVSKTRFRDFHTPRKKSKNKILFLWKLEISIFAIFEDFWKWIFEWEPFEMGTFWAAILDAYYLLQISKIFSWSRDIADQSRQGESKLKSYCFIKENL